MQILPVFTGIALSLFLQCLCVLADEVRPPLKLGAIVSLSGPAAKNGENWLEGARLALDDLRREGHKVDLVVEDDETVTTKAATAFVKLATIDRAGGVIGGTWDFLAEAVCPLAKRYAVPFVTPTNPKEILSAAASKNPWVFTNAPGLEAERTAIRRFLKKQGVKRMSLVYIEVPYGTLHARLMGELAAELGISIVSDSQVTYEGFRETIAVAALKTSQKRPDLVFIVLNYEGVDLLLRELERMKFSPLVLMTHTLDEAFAFGKSPARYRKSYGIYPQIASRSFVEKFVSKYKRPPYDYAATGYDAVAFMAKALMAGIKPASSEASFVYEGVSGRHSLPPHGRSLVESPASIMYVNQSGELEAY